MAFDDVFGGCRAFCSFGLSNYAELLGEVSEVVLPVTTGWEVSPEILIFALTQIITRVEKIGWGITVQFREEFPDFVKDYQKVALYLALPDNFPKDFRQIRCDGELVQLYHAFFLTEAEYKLKLREGASRLEDTLQKCGPDVFDLSRKSCL
jgi:hypothetical protein